MWKCHDCGAELSCDGLMEALELIKHQILDWDNTSYRQCSILPGVVTKVAKNAAMVIVSSLVEDVLIVMPYTIPLRLDHFVMLDRSYLFLALNQLWQLCMGPLKSLDCFQRERASALLLSDPFL